MMSLVTEADPRMPGRRFLTVIDPEPVEQIHLALLAVIVDLHNEHPQVKLLDGVLTIDPKGSPRLVYVIDWNTYDEATRTVTMRWPD